VQSGYSDPDHLRFNPELTSLHALAGKLDQEKPAECRVAHCILGFGHPELAPFEPRFVEKVPRVQDALTRVLREDANRDKRATAAFLLAYAATPEQIAARLVPSIRDPEGMVRNNVLRVLAADAAGGPEARGAPGPAGSAHPPARLAAGGHGLAPAAHHSRAGDRGAQAAVG
jgi:hypothetical protein